MHFVFRADASLAMGIGHVMRCLALANGLRAQGQQVSFMCQNRPGNLIEAIERQGFFVFVISPIVQSTIEPVDELVHAHWLGMPQHADAAICAEYLRTVQPDWVIVDHYALDYRWQVLLQPYYKRLMVIDDLADRRHSGQLLLDQTYGRVLEDYRGLVPADCRLLLTAEYALLRPEFVQWRDKSRQRRHFPVLQKMLITLGGVDKDNITGQVLAALRACVLPEQLTIDVVLGETAPHLAAVRQMAASMQNRTDVKVNVDNMAELMAMSDIAIGAAGATTWERCCLGVPTATLVLAENQQVLAQHLATENIIWLLSFVNLQAELRGFFANLKRADMAERSHKAMCLVDGMGVDKVVRVLMQQRERC